MRPDSPLVATPADQRRISDGEMCAHFSSTISIPVSQNPFPQPFVNKLKAELEENLKNNLQERHAFYLSPHRDHHKKSGWRTMLPAGIT
jgi:hypothetical protein